MARAQLPEGGGVMVPSHPTDDLAILNLVDEGICAFDLRGRITFWNPACEELYGHTRAQAIGRVVRDVFNCDQTLRLDRIANEIGADGRWRGEFRRRNARGEEIVVDARWALRRDCDGSPIEFVETGRDVTVERRAAEELARSEAKYRILFDHMPLPLVRTNAVELLSLFRKLRAEGVEDLGAYIDAHPGLMEHLLGIILVDEVNQPMVELLGAADKTEVTGCIARFWKSNPDTIRRSLEARFRGDTGYVEETQVDTLDGRLVEIVYSVAYPAELNQLGMGITALIDNTERKRATEEIRQSEIKFRNLFNQTPIALWQLDSRDARQMLDTLYASGVSDYDAFVAANPDFLPALRRKMRITEINQAALALVGAADGDRSSPIVFDHLFDSMDALHASAARRRGEASFSTESKVQTLDGRVLDVLSSVAFADPTDPDALNLVAAIDISDRKRAGEELRRSERKFRDLFNKTPIALWQLDTRETRGMIDAVLAAGAADLEAYVADHPDFLRELLGKLRITEINDAALRLFGAPDVESLRPNMLTLWINSTDLLGASAARAAGNRTYDVETRIRTMDGRTVDIWLSTAFGDPSDPKDPNLVGAIDISDRKRAEEMLRKVQADFAHAARVATLGELTASIAHEVNQPLAAIVTNGEASLRWLAREEPDVEEVRTLAGRMVADARRAADIIARIRSMASSRGPDYRPVSVNEAARSATSFLQHELASRHAVLNLDLAPDLPRVRADCTQLQQLFVNLAVNALQAMAQQGTARPTITLRTSTAADGNVLVEIDDNGPGIPEHHLAHIFDSFFTTKEDGLGIGLSICRSIVEAHGGRIACANLPTGARFSFTLPVAEQNEARQAAAA
jgi:PAS domain S-box-containing protein